MDKNQQKQSFKEIEEKWIKFWEEENIYKFDSSDTKKPIFSFDTPPPTVSGRLHMGHALGDAHQDFFARFRRMQGYNVLNPFGTDNNGLPTLKLVEKEKNVNSRDMKREDFIDLCNKTINEDFIPMFLNDMKNLGISADFDIFYSTIDQESRRISQKSFIDLYNMGREYRIESPALWCPVCQTTISQVELEDKEVESYFNDIVFKVDGEELMVATTRPELLPACVAVFVHPEDSRKNDLVGKKAKVPLFDFEVPIIEDPGVDKEKGTGIVMCCTFGDQSDMEWQKSYQLPIKEAITKDGKMKSIAGDYQGMKIEDARKKIIEDLKEKGLLKNQEKISHVVNVCERCKNPIEILSHKQWFVKYLDLKEDMIKWGSEVNWYPKHMKTRYDNWIKGLKWDWCISRQIPFGIPFPVWYCSNPECEEIILAKEESLPVDPIEQKPHIEKCPKCGNTGENWFKPETDIINTWATSALTPTIVKERLKDTPIYEKIKDQPFNLRRNGQDIITFWDFNTIVKSKLHYGIEPWKELYINGWMLGRDGRKMSKSLGNGISPQEVIESHGSDVLRYLCASIGPSEAVPFSDKELTAGKRLSNKLANASKFVFMNLKDTEKEKLINKPEKLEKLDEVFLERFNQVIEEATIEYENYNILKVKLNIEKFFWKEFTDNYIEIVKKRIYQGSEQEKISAQYTLYQTLLGVVKILAPIMPFVTEEIYHNYFKEIEPSDEKSIHLSEWPEAKKSSEEKTEILERLYEIIRKIRQEKTHNKKSMNSEINLSLDKQDIEMFGKEFLKELKNVANAKKIEEGDLSVEFL